MTSAGARFQSCDFVVSYEHDFQARCVRKQIIKYFTETLSIYIFVCSKKLLTVIRIKRFDTIGFFVSAT